MAKIVQRRRGTTVEHSSFTGLIGEITVNTDLDTVVVHDGSTVGGFPLARSDGSNLSSLAAGSISGSSLVNNSIGIAQIDVTDGSAGQVLSTDGAGNLSFISQTTGLSSLGISDGTVGQILQTNGAGVLSFVDKPADGAPGASGISLALAIAVG